jgi:amino acid adenylation domain-containing protein
VDTGTGALAAEFERLAGEDPGAVCVESADGTPYTRAQVDERAERIAGLLERNGVRPGSVVGLHARTSVELICCVVAIFKCGAVYLPLDPALPAGRVARILARARPVLVLADAAPRRWGSWPGPVVDVAGARGERPGRRRRGRAGVAGHAPACLVFTSGSTGEPKGAVLPVSALLTYVRWCRSAFGSCAGTRIAQLAPICFDVSLQETVASLVLGRTIVVAPPELRRSPAELAGWLARRRVGHVLVPNILLTALCDAVLTTGTKLPHLRQVVQAGGQLFFTRSLAAFTSGHPHVTVRNNYGATEMQDATSHVVTGGTGELGEVCPIGRPVAGYAVHVLDDRLGPVRRGEVGELYVAGPAIALGYVHDAALTASRFVANPFGDPSSRLYRTKDLGFEDPDGNLVYVGRADEEVKVNGVRVHPAEVESALREHPAVAEAAIVPFDRSPGARALAAFVVLRPGAGDVGSLRDHLADRVPAYSLPARIVACARLPVTDTGKVDRRSLVGEVERTGGSLAGLRFDELVLEAVRQVVGASVVTADDNFIALGGDSLAAIAVEGAVRKAGVELSAGDVLDAADLGELVTVAGLRRRDRPGPGAAPAGKTEMSVRLSDTELLRMAKGR